MPTSSTERGAAARSADQQLLAARAARYARAAPAPLAQAADSGIELMAFLRGDTRYAVPLTSLLEVRTLRLLTRVPGASAVVPGVFHHRGRILSAHDLSAFFGSRAETPPRWVLIVEHGGLALGLLSDDLLGAARHPATAWAEVPLSLANHDGCVDALLPERTLLLRPDRLFASPRFYSAFP